MWWIGAAYSMLSFTVALSLFFAAVKSARGTAARLRSAAAKSQR